MENCPELPTEEEAQVSKIQELLTESDSETAQFCFEEETIEEVMRQFYNELAGSIVAPPQKPSSSPHVTDTADNNGSCGASVSDSNSTVMAGIQLAGSVGGLPVGKMKMEGEVESDELDDEWLGRVLSWEQGQQPVESKLWF